MEELYYFPTVKMNAKISEIVLEGQYMEMEGYRYEELSKKPRGRSILRKLVSETSNIRMTIYK
jgi:hypothetical protein|tara:strand:+ start:4705 stop:4893 length:189 start_codon:yes stop_codon:yes gene_type:complete